MNHNKKIEQIIDVALNDELETYETLIKLLKKQLPLFNGAKRIAAAILKEHLGEINLSNIDLASSDVKIKSKKSKKSKKSSAGSVVFEDVKNGKARLFINIGKNHRVSTGDLIREIVKHSGIDGKSIGKIDVHSTYSFFEIPEHSAEMVYHSFGDARIKGIPVVVEPAKKKRKNI